MPPPNPASPPSNPGQRPEKSVSDPCPLSPPLARQEEESQLFEALRASEREAERIKAMKSEARRAREHAIRAAQAAEAAELRARHLEERFQFEARSTPTKDWRPGEDVEVDFGVAMNARAGAWDEEDEDAFTLAEALRVSEEEFERDRRSRAREEGERRAQDWFNRVSGQQSGTPEGTDGGRDPPTPPSRQPHFASSPVRAPTHDASMANPPPSMATPPHLDPSFLRGPGGGGGGGDEAPGPVDRRGAPAAGSIAPEELEETRQLLEALARSKEEADLVEALRRSEAESTRMRTTRTIHTTTTTTTTIDGVDVNDVRLSPRSPGRVRYGDGDLDLAGMAFRRAVFGAGERPDPSAPPASFGKFFGSFGEGGFGEGEDDAVERRAAERAAEAEARLRRMEERLNAEKAAAEERRVERERVREEREQKEREEREKEATRRANEAARDARAAEAARREAAMKAAARRAAEERAERERARERAEELREDAAAAAEDDIGGEDLPGALRALGLGDVDEGDPAAVKRAYRKAALRYHPDRTRGYTLEQRLKGEEVWKLLAQKMEAFNRRIS